MLIVSQEIIYLKWIVQIVIVMFRLASIHQKQASTQASIVKNTSVLNKLSECNVIDCQDKCDWGQQDEKPNLTVVMQN